MSPSHPEQPDAPAFDMSITVGLNTAKAAGLTRADCDEWAVRSHHRAVQAIDEGRFDEEIVPIEVKMRDGSTKVFAVDEHPRRDSTIEKMASLKPLHPEIEDFPITAGNASGLNDGAAAMMIVSSDYAAAHGLDAARQDRVVGVDRHQPARHRSRPDPVDPEGARPRGHDHRRREPRGDQRGVRVGAGCRVPQARPVGGDHQRERLRLLARPPGRLHRARA